MVRVTLSPGYNNRGRYRSIFLRTGVHVMMPVYGAVQNGISAWFMENVLTTETPVTDEIGIVCPYGILIERVPWDIPCIRASVKGCTLEKSST